MTFTTAQRRLVYVATIAGGAIGYLARGWLDNPTIATYVALFCAVMFGILINDSWRDAMERPNCCDACGGEVPWGSAFCDECSDDLGLGAA